MEVFTDITSDVENVDPAQDVKSGKYIKDGALYIKSGENTYDILGTQVK